MRTIKFRAWHKQEQKMYEVVSYCCSGKDDNGDVEIFYDGKYRGLMAKNIETMQYTGIKDCKGTEICEGDIVKWKIFPEDKEPKYIMDVVVYRGGAFALEKRMELLGGIAPCRKLEVIGNIYQHCELVKGEEEQ